MEYLYNIDGINFIASKNDIDLNMKKIDFLYEAMNNADCHFFSLIVTDSKQIETEVIKKLQQFDYKIYDISKFTAEYPDVYFNNLDEINNSLFNAEKTCIIETLKYGRFLDDIHNFKDPYFNYHFSTSLMKKEKGGIYLYNYFFNYYRDDYRLCKSKITIIMNELELYLFQKCAPDYYSYCNSINFNHCFKPVINNTNYNNLIEYNINKIIGEENNEPKRFRKRI